MKIKVLDNENQRLDQFLSDYFEDISRSKFSNLIKNDCVFVNGVKQKSKYIVKLNDVIDVELDCLKIKKLEPQNLSIEILYEDEDIAIINKPKGIISHPTNSIRTNTVVNFLMSMYENLPNLNGEDREGIVHRLDKDTSGLMIVALNDESMINLKSMFENRSIIKKYRAIVNNRFENLSGIIEKNISRSMKNRKLMTVDENGKYAKTGYKVVMQNSQYAYLDIELFTGRTHQIRVHLSSINHPILGDKDYNNNKSNFNIDGQLLQAYYLEFKHPITNKLIKIEIPMYPEFSKYYNIIFGEEGINEKFN
ncbi:RluA family pseudouridine synthase [Helcococcus ovis]|uniref:Pseudouridine synthase n=1 Tax=Helcococcus ovis TaxID=72026 RepID=A0A4R9C2T0_9FIRM|nr:RluA family pseudouridine synthase [Helcococcus ovis]TFF64474.1 RluA family pseudouridine synthase [Helcococcus ovis]TFF64908.1 RluA family pseudouridine synthase [Helcococcus ovis]TFF68120.1 RluA family pseudouridine synthase [Helcococcus ovis]WNZ01978.1 RluA family pseudouridine synthase [Helcococcus ovis]